MGFADWLLDELVWFVVRLLGLFVLSIGSYATKGRQLIDWVFMRMRGVMSCLFFSTNGGSY